MVGAGTEIAHHAAAEFREGHARHAVLHFQAGQIVLKDFDGIRQLLQQCCMRAFGCVGRIYLLAMGIVAALRHHVDRCLQSAVDQTGYNLQLIGQSVSGRIGGQVLALVCGVLDGRSILLRLLGDRPHVC